MLINIFKYLLINIVPTYNFMNDNMKNLETLFFVKKKKHIIVKLTQYLLRTKFEILKYIF